MQIKRNILLNPGPATTTDTVKMAQVVPDICPREKEFASMMKQMREDLVRIVHGNLNKYTSVLFCGSGTMYNGCNGCVYQFSFAGREKDTDYQQWNLQYEGGRDL